jgi:predicted glycosyltransferase
LRVLFDVAHPTDVNVFRNVIKKLEKEGHSTKVTARDKENTVELLKTYGLDYAASPHYKGMLNKALGLPKTDYFVYKVAKGFSPDVFVSAGTPYAAQVSKILGKPHIAFPNTEHAKIAIYLSKPFTDLTCTPTFFKRDLGKKQKRFNGFNEFTYLHPNYFIPDKSILDDLGLQENEYILVRFSSLDSHHDLSAKGFDFKDENEALGFINKLEEFGRVVITSELKIGSRFEKFKLSVPFDKWHDFLFYAKMYIGEGAKTASEGAILGVPSIFVSNTRRGYLDELEERYDMAYTIPNREEALKKAIALLSENNLKDKWQLKRNRMLKEKIDTVEFMLDTIENMKR